MTEDTEPGNREEPLSQNRYVYVLNNPVNYADPTGHRRTLRSAVRNITKKAGSYVKKAVSSVASVVRTRARTVQSAADKVRSSIAQFTKRTSATLGKMIRPLGSSQSSSLKNARSAYRTPTGNTISARTAAAMASSNTAQNKTKVRGCGKAQKIKTTVTNFGNNVKTGWQNMSTDQKVTFCIAIALGVGITVMTFGAAAPVVGTGIAFMAAGAAGVGFSAGFYDMASYENPTTVERDTIRGAETGARIAGDILMVGGTVQLIKGVGKGAINRTVNNIEKNMASTETSQSTRNNFSVNNKRPSWRQSELDARNDFPDYREQVSFKNGQEVPYGTKGSVRPDFYKEGFSVDVKNYDISNPQNRTNLINNILNQYKRRSINLTEGTKQTVLIDIRGQQIEDTTLQLLYNDIMKKTDNNVRILFKVK